MIVNVYLNNGKFLESRVDEDTLHPLGDIIISGDKKYVVVTVEEREHIDYQAVVRVNLVNEKSDEIEVDEVSGIGL